MNEFITYLYLGIILGILIVISRQLREVISILLVLTCN